MVRGKVSVRHRDFIKAAVTVGASFVLFQFRALFFLFLVPLFLFGLGSDRKSTVKVVAAVWLTLLVQGFVLTAGISESGISRGLLLLIDLSYPTLLLAALGGFFYYKERALIKLLFLTALAGVVSVPVIMAAASDSTLTGLLRDQIIAVTKMLRDPLSESHTFEASLLMAELDPQEMVETTRNLFFRFYLAGFFLMLSFGYVLARAIRSRFSGDARIQASAFKVPENMIWALLASLPLIALDHFFDLGAVGYPFWNLGTVMLLIYGFQGIGIIKFRMAKSERLQRSRFFLVLLFMFLMFMPVVNMIALLAIPLLGVSELWIRYREV
jgi:hypothetical protein